MHCSAIAYPADWLCLQIEVRPPVRAAFAAGRACEGVLDVRETDVIRPSLRAEHHQARAAVVLAIDHDTANAGRAHFAEGDRMAPVGVRNSRKVQKKPAQVAGSTEIMSLDQPISVAR
jgi:hypothetical protein